MSRKELGRVSVFGQLKEGTMTKVAAATKLGLSLRHIKRLWSTYTASDYDPASLAHALRGRPSNHQVDPALVARAVAVVRDKYPDFGPTFAAETLAEQDDIVVSHDTLRRGMIAAGLWQPKRRRRPVVHVWRERRALRGELVQADGSPHAWFEDRGAACTLLQFIDDATSEDLWLEFVASESTNDVMQATWHYLETHGRPHELYVDRGGVFKVNLRNEDDDKVTQYERALQELGIALIHARSPQAKGRVERGFQTHQDRLVKELRLAEISTMAAANDFLRAVYLPKHNRKFAVPARQPGDAHRSLDGYDLDSILCTKEERIITNDLTISYKGRWLQLAPRQHTIVRPKHVVTVREHLDGRLTVVYGRTELDVTEVMKRLARPVIPTPQPPRPRVSYAPAPNHPWRTYQQPVTVLLRTKG